MSSPTDYTDESSTSGYWGQAEGDKSACKPQPTEQLSAADCTRAGQFLQDEAELAQAIQPQQG